LHPPALAVELQLDEADRRPVKVADGATHALQDLDLIVVPALETVTVHPASPHGSRGVALGYRT